MSWGMQPEDWEEEDAPLRTVSPAALLKLHRVSREQPTEEQAKAMRGLRDRDRFHRVFTK